MKTRILFIPPTAALIVLACTGGGDTVEPAGDGGSGDGGGTNAADCPRAAPTANTGCPRDGLACRYGSGCSSTYASCSNGRWDIAMPSCPVEENTCASAGGQCTCGEVTEPCSNGGARDRSKSCPQGPPGSGACSTTCCMPPSDAGRD